MPTILFYAKRFDSTARNWAYQPNDNSLLAFITSTILCYIISTAAGPLGQHICDKYSTF